MKAGKVGILVIMISLAGMLGIGWFMSMDVVMTEKTVYNELTDITPLFGSEQAPEFTDYTPSTNYTGYYTDDSTIDGVKYFAGVDYDTSARANIYRLNLAPTSTTSPTSYDLTGTTSTADNGLEVFYWSANNNMQQVQTVGHLKVSELITTLGMGSYTKVTVTSSAQPVDWSTADSFISFIPIGELSGGPSTNYIGYMKNPSLTGDLDRGLGMKRAASDTTDVILAMQYDSQTGYVTLYRDVDMTDQYPGIFSPDQVFILWGGNSGVLYNFVFGTDIIYSGQLFPGLTYMDPTKGVEMI